jgi:NADH-quinone oxidoreductase subunit L
MLELLWLVPLAPLAGFLILAVAGARLPKRAVAAVGVGSVGVALAAAGAVAAGFFALPETGRVYEQSLGTWLAAGDLAARFVLHLDALALVMMAVVTLVGFLIFLYSAESMVEDEGYARFFCYMNLFVASMLVLVLAGDLLLLYLGWEGVGLCSYLLIGFWYREPANVRAAKKAFIVTRVGDAALLVGLLVLFTQLGTSDIGGLLAGAGERWPVGAPVATLTALLLLAGAVGKSAQLPLQVWLPDAMAGPTPVSALIHAATMVTAGVYLLARMHGLFALAPAAATATAVIGAATLLLAGTSALVQRDIKRVLAYSTMSQVGYMFLALGVGAWGAGIFHFVTHAVFKSLLFLAAGAVIAALSEEHDLFKMGGLRRRMPLVFWTFLAGAVSLAALPLVTAGFYSKEEILSAAWAGPTGGQWFWAAGAVGAAVTALYTGRMVFLVFFGETKREPARQPGWAMATPLVILAALSLGGWWLDPRWLLGGTEISAALPVRLAGSAAAVAGIVLAWYFYLRRPELAARAAQSRVGAGLGRWWFGGWGFDWLYNLLFIRPYIWLTQLGRDELFDAPYRALGRAMDLAHVGMSWTVTGRVRWYAAAIAAGAIAAIAAAVWR